PLSSSPNKQIADLGCGPRNLTPFIHESFPDPYSIQWIDTSLQMLEKARGSDHEFGIASNATQYIQADFETFSPGVESLDLLFSNATLHWVSFDVHTRLLPRLMSFLKPGGVLAFQIPDTRAQPSHLLMIEAAHALGLQDRIKSTRWVACEKDPHEYYRLLSPLASCVNLWHSTYTFAMEGENPVADFTASTGLGPYVDALGGLESEDGKRYVAKYRELIAKVYPKDADGKKLFRLNRFFVVAQK
ncbi:putative trans-aconitate 2-methyltransferase, partial [Chytriomyces cf. hyalinus JEL632]